MRCATFCRAERANRAVAQIDKRMTAAEVVARLRSGMTLGIGGWGARRKPMALVREILRSDLTDLTLVSYGGPDVGMLCAAGKVRKLVFAFVSLDEIPLEPWFRKARESGAIEVLELDEGMFQWGLKAAAFGLPFLPTRVGFGTDLIELGGLKTVTSPYDDGEVLVAMPALKLDAALIHVHRADRRGNVQALGPDTYYDEWFAKAAGQCFASSEQLVEVMEAAHSGDARANIVERCFISGVVAASGGAHPTSMPPAYGWDMAWLQRYAGAAKDPGDWSAIRDWAVARDEDTYVTAAGGETSIAALPLPVF